MINIDTILTLFFMNATLVSNSDTSRCTSLASTMSHYENHPFYSPLKTEYDHSCVITSVVPRLDMTVVAWSIVSLFFVSIILIKGAKKST